jgi:hypothetical protein
VLDGHGHGKLSPEAAIKEKQAANSSDIDPSLFAAAEDPGKQKADAVKVLLSPPAEKCGSDDDAIAMEAEMAAEKAKLAGKSPVEIEEEVVQAAKVAAAKHPDKALDPQKAVEAAVAKAKDKEELRVLQEDSSDLKEESQLEAVAAKASAIRGEKNLQKKEAQMKQAELAEEAEALKENEAKLAIKLKRAKAEVSTACTQLAKAEASEKKCGDAVEKKKNELKGKDEGKAKVKKEQQQQAFDKATKVAAKRVLAARKAAEMASIAAGQTPEQAEAAGKKAQIAQAKSLAAQAATAMVDSPCKTPEAKGIYDKINGCNGWSPRDGPFADKGQFCATWGWTRRWCWMDAGYTGPGHEFTKESDAYPGKHFSPCVAKGPSVQTKFSNKYQATWAATGCPNIPGMHDSKQSISFFMWYESQSDADGLKKMYKDCKSKEPEKMTVCCGQEDDCKNQCT